MADLVAVCTDSTGLPVTSDFRTCPTSDVDGEMLLNLLANNLRRPGAAMRYEDPTLGDAWVR